MKSPGKVAIQLCMLAGLGLLFGAAHAQSQGNGRDGWIEEPAAVVEGEPGRSYLDPASVRRGEDGLVYFNESTGVTKSEEIGQKGFMKDAYDCSKNVKYMCVGLGDWKNDLKSTINTSNDPALNVYRKYLCGDANLPSAR